MIKRIYMDRAMIAANKRDGLNEPAIVVRTSKGPVRGIGVQIDGPSRVYQQAKPNKLAGGASVWIQTNSPVRVMRRGDDHVDLA